ncbi:hypothetical protein CBR_g52299 [Chara braunii]|uniref:Uncharacterized protein n=1 Tax=Chara braunii TaxID=69332 RepID=A0A388MAC5_CHABU|nr:hypothetical protein CBR_g52299 [Chara braunii]|eukprot:GBG91412.1 hypothetical protein CBR_g52299 [Chara braunii]
MVASRGQRGQGVLAQGTTHVELLQETGLSENLQRQAQEWVAELEDTQQRMQQIVGALASVARAGSVVDWGGSTMTAWLEDKCQQLSTILWQIVEDPELEPFVDWQRANTLIMNCNMIFSDGVDYYDQLKERLSIETSMTARATMISATTTINTMELTSLLASAAASATSDFAKTTMPRGGRGTRPPWRPLGASGGYERHESRHREHTPVYDDGDIELFLDDFRGHADHMGWTMTQTIERLRGADRFEEPIARICREPRTWLEVEMRMQELRPSPVGPDGRPIRLEIGNVEDFIPAFEQFMHDQRVLRDEWARTSHQYAGEEVAPSGGSLQELKAHLDMSQWRVPQAGEGHDEPTRDMLQEEIHEPEWEIRQSAERGAMEEVVEVGEDTPPQALAAELGPEIVPEIAREEEEEPQ